MTLLSVNVCAGQVGDVTQAKSNPKVREQDAVHHHGVDGARILVATSDLDPDTRATLV